MPIPSFNVLRRYAVIGFMACAASWAPLASAQPAPTPVVAINSLPIEGPASYTVYEQAKRGPVFLTGAVPTRIVELSFGLDLDELPTTATLSLYLLEDPSNFPTGAALASTTLNMIGGGSSVSTTVHTYSAADLGAIATTTLQAGQKYALIMSNSSLPVGITNDDLNDNAYTYAGGFSAVLNGDIGLFSDAQGWDQSDGTLAFSMTVVPFADPVPPTATLTCTPTELLAVAGQVSTCTVTLSAPSTTDTLINLTLPATNPGYTTTCTSPLVVPANATQATCTITAVANTTPGAPDVTADLAIAPPTTPDAYTVEGPAAQITIRSNGTVVPPANPTPVPTLGAAALVSLVSVMGLLGLRRTRKSA
ncbi:hypothetical protein [Comamonas sp.]|uniref:hypothetical protein n=1 Tax=Comamonas sp. TaxID=34028 RepID=UPI0028A0D907|nr:hypothetical protein [Comamonas sp.]